MQFMALSPGSFVRSDESLKGPRSKSDLGLCRDALKNAVVYPRPRSQQVTATHVELLMLVQVVSADQKPDHPTQKLQQSLLSEKTLAERLVALESSIVKQKAFLAEQKVLFA